MKAASMFGFGMLGVGLLTALACKDKKGSSIDDSGASGGEDGGGEDGGAEAVAHPTWYQDVQPIVAEHCWTCHDGTNEAAFDLTDPNMVAELADWLYAKMDGPDVEPPYYMPPFPMVEHDECDLGLPVVGDMRVPSDKLETFGNWIADGTPMGDPETAADYVVPPMRQMHGDRFVDLPPMHMQTHDGLTGNAYLCWSWDLGLEEGAWVTGIQVNPDNLNILHHAVIMADFSNETKPLPEEDPDGDGSGPCPSPGDSVPDATMIATWVPGADPIMVAEGSAIYFPPGTRIVSATHYHPDGVGQTDDTNLTVAFRSTPPDYQVFTYALGAASPSENDVDNWQDGPFLLEAGDSDYQVTWRQSNRRGDDGDYRIYGLFLHAHYAMTNFRVSLEREAQDGEPECLIDVPVWDFEWQRTYEYDVPFEQLPKLYNGDVWKFECGYDNTWDNPVLSDALLSAGYDELPDIQIGKGYLDEMCVVHALVMTPYDGRYEKE